LPLFKSGKIEKLKGRKKIFVIKDAIHSDYVFESKDWTNIFKTDKKYVSIGWGDRSIFLETQKWADLKIENFVKAFFGLNKTVLRVDFLDEIPKEKRLKKFTANKKQFNALKKHITNSYNKQKIKKENINLKNKILILEKDNMELKNKLLEKDIEILKLKYNDKS